MQVGYVPYSQDLQHPGDRRRLASWAMAKNHNLNIVDPLDSDVLVLSNAANFGYWLKRADQPVILDLVDGYLGENPSFLRDVLRNIVRSVGGTSSLRWITYTKHLKRACSASSAVIVASPEQRELVLPFNSNVFVVLDNHSELSDNTQSANVFRLANSPKDKFIFWEGFGYTLKHFKFMAKILDKFLFENGWGMYLITVKSFPRWGGYIGKVSTDKLIKKMFPLSFSSIHLIPWSIENLLTYARKSMIAIIPIDPNDGFATNKSENKLLSSWKLGLPTLFSDTPAYKRVGISSQTTSMCVDSLSWKESLEKSLLHDSFDFNLQITASEYLQTTHSQELLINKWDDLLLKTLKGKNA